MTSYETIFTRFLRKIDDVELARQIELYSDLAEEDMIGWLHSAVARIGCIEHESITLNDEDKCVEEDLSEVELEFYSLGMKVEWLTPIVESRVNLAQMFGGKEEKFFSQSNHLSELREQLYQDKLEIRKMRRDHGYRYNDYISTKIVRKS